MEELLPVMGRLTQPTVHRGLSHRPVIEHPAQSLGQVLARRGDVAVLAKPGVLAATSTSAGPGTHTNILRLRPELAKLTPF